MTATLSLTVVAAVLVSSPLFGLRPGHGRSPGVARRALAPQVVVWVGDLAPGLRGVLTPVWGEPGPDEAHDETLNQELSSRRHLAFYRLLLFNTAEETRRVPLLTGALEIRPDGDQPPGRLQSLPALLREGVASASPALVTVLEAQGALEEELVLPPGMMADVLVVFDRHVPLEQAQGVEGTDGATFARRRIERGVLEALLEAPDASRIRDL